MFPLPTTPFKKGAVVWMLRNYDSKGTICIQKMRVGSWGKKQACFLDMVDETIGERFYVNAINQRTASHINFNPWVVAEDTDAQAVAREMGEFFLTCEREHLAQRIAQACNESHLQSFVEAMEKKTAELHEVRVLDYTKEG